MVSLLYMHCTVYCTWSLTMYTVHCVQYTVHRTVRTVYTVLYCTQCAYMTQYSTENSWAPDFFNLVLGDKLDTI